MLHIFSAVNRVKMEGLVHRHLNVPAGQQKTLKPLRCKWRACWDILLLTKVLVRGYPMSQMLARTPNRHPAIDQGMPQVAGQQRKMRKARCY